MSKKTWLKIFKMKDQLGNLLKDERGETNMIAIILIIGVVIALVAVFKGQLENMVNDLFDKIRGEAGLATD